jgi:hypothetical protein
MNWINQLERKFGHLAIPHLVRGVVVLNFLLWLPAELSPMVRDFLVLDRARVLDGEVWRLITFIFMPPDVNPIFVIFAFFFMWMIADGLESAWGAFRLNLFYLIGIIGTAAAGMLFSGGAVGNVFLNASLLFAFATIYPDYEILFMLFIPLKMKWVGLITAVGFLYAALVGGWGQRATILVAFLNYLIFFYPTLVDTVQLNRQTNRARARFHGSIRQVQSETFHECAVCGKTEADDSTLDFRIASDGKEYCEEHLPAAQV